MKERKRNILILLAILVSFVLGAIYGSREFVDKESTQIIHEYGYIQRIAYESAIEYCLKTNQPKTCDALMIQTSSPYNSEPGAGVYFIFSTARKQSIDKSAVVVFVDISSDGKIREVRGEDSDILNNSPLP